MRMNVLMLVAFTGMTIEWNMEGDHINGDTSDNRLENLRPVTGEVNKQNVKWIDYRKMLVDFLMSCD